MSEAFASVLATSDNLGVSLRTAAYAQAIKVVADATEYRASTRRLSNCHLGAHPGDACTALDLSGWASGAEVRGAM